MARVPSLVDSVKVPITYKHYIGLLTIDGHNFREVRAKVSQEYPNYSDEHLDLGINYLKRYYAIHILDPLNPPAMSLPVDPFWHTHVLYTEDYINFCDLVFGEYLDHIPLLYADKLAVAFVVDMYNHTRERHREIFGDVDARFIPELDRGGHCCSPSAALRLKRWLDVALFPEDKLIRIAPGDKDIIERLQGVALASEAELSALRRHQPASK